MTRTRKQQKFTLYTCPDRKKHTKAPEGYQQWHDWADRKSRTHYQVKCSTCGLYAIWVKKDAKMLAFDKAANGLKRLAKTEPTHLREDFILDAVNQMLEAYYSLVDNDATSTREEAWTEPIS